jgi:hypothetical protein
MAVILVYVIPFYLRDPEILSKGLAYHNSCYIDAWRKSQENLNIAQFDQGINFSYYVFKFTTGSAAHKIMISRIIQASAMIFVNTGGILFFRKFKHQLLWNDFCLSMLYLIILLFFMFNPVCYLYYYFPFLLVSAVLCYRVVVSALTPNAE